jgi:predicted HAD superfamily hydrolase
MNSWDCFDTLVARRFFHPHSIFEEVERISGCKGFVKLRKSFEKTGNLTYKEIYDQITDVDPDLEFNLELEHCFGIPENINKVKDGDIIISDMYLSESQVRKILENCGLKKDVKIIVTLDGKKYLYNMNKPLNAALSKAVFEALHTNTQVNTSSYKRNTYNTQESIQAKNQERKNECLFKCFLRFREKNKPNMFQQPPDI